MTAVWGTVILGLQCTSFCIVDFFPTHSERLEIMGSMQNNCQISSETFKLCSGIIRHI